MQNHQENGYNMNNCYMKKGYICVLFVNTWEQLIKVSKFILIATTAGKDINVQDVILRSTNQQTLKSMPTQNTTKQLTNVSNVSVKRRLRQVYISRLRLFMKIKCCNAQNAAKVVFENIL